MKEEESGMGRKGWVIYTKGQTGGQRKKPEASDEYISTLYIH